MTAAGAPRLGRPPKVSAAAILDVAALLDRVSSPSPPSRRPSASRSRPSTYYFANKEELTHALSQRFVAELGMPELTATMAWQQVLEALGLWAHHIGMRVPIWSLDQAGSLGAGLGSLDQALNLRSRPSLGVNARGEGSFVGLMVGVGSDSAGGATGW